MKTKPYNYYLRSTDNGQENQLQSTSNDTVVIQQSVQTLQEEIHAALLDQQVHPPTVQQDQTEQQVHLPTVQQDQIEQQVNPSSVQQHQTDQQVDTTGSAEQQIHLPTDQQDPATEQQVDPLIVQQDSPNQQLVNLAPPQQLLNQPTQPQLVQPRPQQPPPQQLVLPPPQQQLVNQPTQQHVQPPQQEQLVLPPPQQLMLPPPHQQLVNPPTHQQPVNTPTFNPTKSTAQTFNMASGISLKKFDGSENVHVWLRMFENWQKFHNISDVDALHAVGCNFEGQAATWLQTLNSAQTENLQIFTECLRNRFSATETNTLLGLRQAPGESTSEYVSRAEKT